MSTIQHVQYKNYFSKEIHSAYATSNNPRNDNNSFQDNSERKKELKPKKNYDETRVGTSLDIIV